MPREVLYQRIDTRVDGMLREGLLEEVIRLSSRYPRECLAFQGLGYKELFDCIDGKRSIEEAAETIKRKTRNYAKRQLTWFKREKLIQWYDIAQYQNNSIMLEDVFGYINRCLHMSDTANGGI
jgi:tRNA dimethylallyltransferase